MNQHLPEPAQLKILVADDHEVFLGGATSLLSQHYPQVEIRTAQTVEAVLHEMEQFRPNLAVLDLALPETTNELARIETGINLLRMLMQRYPVLNLTVQSTHIRSLIRIRPEIDNHRGGFTTIHKNLSSQDMLTRIAWSMQGLTHTKDIGTGIEMKPEWLEVLRLAFHEELQNRAIAERMNIAERTVHLYWTKIQDALGVYPEDGISLRIRVERRAREAGLID